MFWNDALELNSNCLLRCSGENGFYNWFPDLMNSRFNEFWVLLMRTAGQVVWGLWSKESEVMREHWDGEPCSLSPSAAVGLEIPSGPDHNRARHTWAACEAERITTANSSPGGGEQWEVPSCLNDPEQQQHLCAGRTCLRGSSSAWGSSSRSVVVELREVRDLRTARWENGEWRVLAGFLCSYHLWITVTSDEMRTFKVNYCARGVIE